MIRISHWTNAILASVLTKLAGEAADIPSPHQAPGAPMLTKRELEREIERFVHATYGGRIAAGPATGSLPPSASDPVAWLGGLASREANGRDDACPLLTEFIERRAGR